MKIPSFHRAWLLAFAGLLPLLGLACRGPSTPPKDVGTKDRDQADKGKVEPKDGQANGKPDGPDKDAKQPKDNPDKQQPKEQVDQRWAFADTAPGKVTPGWNFNGGQIRIQAKEGSRAIELVGVQGTMATLPPVVLKDPFFLEVEVEFPQQNANVAVQLFGKENRFLYLTLDADAKVMLHSSLPIARAKDWQAEKVNRFRLERHGTEFVVKINGEQVEKGTFPNLKGDFDRAQVGMWYKEKISSSPRIHAVTVGH
jgi:hypothetical protein